MAQPTETRLNDVMVLLKERKRQSVLIMASDLNSDSELVIGGLIARESELLSAKNVKRLFFMGRANREDCREQVIVTNESRPTWGACTGDVYFFTECGECSEETMKILRACSFHKDSKLFIINMAEC